jgi:hypothetical protein
MKYDKIYMLTPPAYVTGGVECSYQLAHTINELGGNCYTIFTANVPNPVPNEYKKYNIQITQDLEVSKRNLFIIPEIFTGIANEPALKDLNFAIWWLSVDHNRGSFNDFNRNDLIHLYQSHYAGKFLTDNGVKNVKILFDPINEDYIDRENFKKDNIICYSVKGQTFADSIKDLLPGYEFIMIQGMTREQVVETLSRSKVFIDFGYHPGRDKIPREAASLMNCIITNRVGAANFYEDIPIADEYKFEVIEKDPIIEKIKDCIENYDKKIKDFEEYRTVIRNQKIEFENQIKSNFI